MRTNTLFFLLVASFSVSAFDANDLKQELYGSETYHDKREGELKTNETHKILDEISPPKPVGEKPPKPVSEAPPKKTSKPSSKKPRKSRRAAPSRPSANQSTNTCPEGFPPSWCQGNVISGVTEQTKGGKNKLAFGIKKGVTFKGALTRMASNAETGEIEITIGEIVIGTLRNLPADSTLFCDKRYNAGTRRLDMVCKSGITKDGEEFNGLIIHVRDEKLREGLVGVVTADKRIVQRAGVATGLEVGTGLAKMATGNNTLVSKAVGAGADSLNKQVGQVAKEKVGRMQNIITVSPTKLLLYVGKTF